MGIEDLKLARTKLDPNNIEDGLPGRESKISEVYNFLYNRLVIRRTAEAKRARILNSQNVPFSLHDNKTMMVCGVPGTGKTVTVMKVLKDLDQFNTKTNSPIEPFRYVYVNGQHFRNSTQIFSEILYKLIGGKQRSPEQALNELERMFTISSEEIKLGERKRRQTRADFKGFTIIVVDELDLIYSESKQNILYTLFDWPSKAEIKVMVIGIANAMDLSDRFIRSGRSRCGWEKCVFEPYTGDDLQLILEVRLGKELLGKSFDKPAVIIASKRIGRTTGDARRILDTCRLAIDEAISISQSSGQFTKVTAKIIDKIGFHNYDEQRAEFVRECRPLELLALKSMLAEIDRVGEENLNALDLYQTLIFQMSKHVFFKKRLPSFDNFEYLLNDMASHDIITLDKHANFNHKKLYLNDDNDALKDIIRSEEIKI